ncbi:MAG: hypothetical protein Q9222_002994 [Ikaeria aurantiellina]
MNGQHVARLALNYKNIPYNTQWLEYPEIDPHLKSLGIPPNPDGTPYTVPAVRFPDGTHVMDSINVAHELEKRYPTPSLHLDSPLLKKITEWMPTLFQPLAPVVMPKIPRNLLNPDSVTYFEETRSKRFGMPLDQFERDHGGDEAWEKAAPAFKEVGELLKAHGGPFLMGVTVSYADFVLLAVLQFCKRIGQGLYERMVEIEPALGKLYEASAKWLGKDT